MVTINQKEASLLEQKTEQIIALVCRREKQKKTPEYIYICVCSFYACCIF